MMNKWLTQEDQTIPNMICCACLVLIESMQALIVIVLIFSFIPMPVSPLIHHLFPRQVQLVFPKRDLFFYHFFVGFVIAGQAGVIVGLRKQLSSASLRERLLPFLFVELGWLFLMVFAVFKFFVYAKAPWTMHLLYAVILASVLSKLFWKELQAAVKTACTYTGHSPKDTRKTVDIIFPLLIIALIFVPDLEAVIARTWIGDCLHHMDSTLMGQAWAFANGAKLNVDIYAHYGLGMPIFITLLAKLFGSLSYEHVMGVLIGGTIIYFILCYFFLRVWLNNVWLAMAGILLAIKWQMFNPGNYPFIFNYPYSTVIRFGFDIIVLLLLLGHLRLGSFYFLVAAALVCGTALFHVSDTGVYLLLTYVFYLGWLAIEGIVHERQSWKDILGRTALCLGFVFFSALLWFLTFQGADTWSKGFWAHMSERVGLFMIGHGNLPMYKSLLEGDYTSSLMGFVVPLVYCGTLLTIFSLCFLKKINRQHIMVAVLCVYGLGLYHYYVPRSANTVYYTVCIPFVFVLCWIAQVMIQSLKPQQGRIFQRVLLGVAAFALFSNHFYLSYPNIFNWSPNPMISSTVKPVVKNLDFYFNNIPRSMPESYRVPLNSLGETDEYLKIETDFKSDAQLKEYFRSEFAFKEDANLIDRLTPSGAHVALISSFETRILMQADRKPFFYYFPLVDSRPMHMRMFPFTSLWTTDRLGVTIKQFETSKPQYVFMEKILLIPQVPQAYEYLFPELIYILRYLDKYYQPYQYGKYLVALKRI
jgi:hypothetical protein